MLCQLYTKPTLIANLSNIIQHGYTIVTSSENTLVETLHLKLIGVFGMERLTDIHALYMETISKNMMSTGTLKQRGVGTNYWQVECQMFEGANRQSCKNAVTEFLQSAWGAVDITFIVAKPGSYGKFICKFCSEILTGHIQNN